MRERTKEMRKDENRKGKEDRTKKELKIGNVKRKAWVKEGEMFFYCSYVLCNSSILL